MGSSDAPAKAQNEIVAQRERGDDGIPDRQDKAGDQRTQQPQQSFFRSNTLTAKSALL